MQTQRLTTRWWKHHHGKSADLMLEEMTDEQLRDWHICFIAFWMAAQLWILYFSQIKFEYSLMLVILGYNVTWEIFWERVDRLRRLWAKEMSDWETAGAENSCDGKKCDCNEMWLDKIR